MRDFVELARLQPASHARVLGLGTGDELGAEVRAEARLGIRLQRPELEHREDAAASADALPAVEDRPASGRRDGERDRGGERQRDEQEECGEEDVERAEDDVAAALRGSLRELAVAANQRVLEAWRRLGHCTMLDRRPATGAPAAQA